MKTIKKFTKVLGISLLFACSFYACSDPSEATDVYHVTEGNFWEYVDSSFSATDTVVGVTRSEVTEVLDVDTLGMHQLYTLSWYNYQDSLFEPFSWLYGVSESEGLLNLGGIDGDDTLLSKSTFVPHGVKVGDTWESVIMRYSRTDSAFYIADTVTITCTKDDTLLSTESIYGDVLAYEFTYTLVDSIGRAPRSVTKDVGFMAEISHSQSQSRASAIVPEDVSLYFAHGYGYVGYTRFENGVKVYKKVLRDMESKHH